MDKVAENKLRRMAKRQALILKRSPRRDRLAVDYGQYALVDAATGNLVNADGPLSIYTLSAEDVEGVLSGR